MLTPLTELADQLAREIQVPTVFMVERLSDIAGAMLKYPSLYAERTGQFTSSGVAVARELIDVSVLSGKLAHQLTAWTAQ